MNRRILALLLCCALCAGLCACAGNSAAKPFEAEGTAQALLDCGGYTDVEDMRPALEPALFFDQLDAGAVTGGGVYSSTYTAELAAVVLFTDEEAAEDGYAVLNTWLADRIEAERNYRPAEAAKLEKAILERRGNTLVLAVAADPAAAKTAIDG